MNMFIINLDYLKYSNNFLIRYRNKLERALKLFDQTKEENTFLMRFLTYLKKIGFSLIGIDFVRYTLIYDGVYKFTNLFLELCS